MCIIVFAHNLNVIRKTYVAIPLKVASSIVLGTCRMVSYS